MEVLSNTAAGKAHGKIILIGEHAVVHNEPAIAIPFTSATVEVAIEKIPGESTMDSIYHYGKLSDAPKQIKNLITTFEEVCQYFNVSTNHFHMTIRSSIPAERGMGSSAAVATAVVRALFNFFNAELTDDLLHRFVSISEKIAHGNPSGLDAKVVSSDEAIYFVKEKRAEPFEIDLPAYLVVADTGDEGETLGAVSAVGKLVADPTSNGLKLVQELGLLTKTVYATIGRKDLHHLGNILDQAQDKLKQLTVSNDKLDRLVEAAKKSGALGAKLTGGGRGGCMIALVDTTEKAQKIADDLLTAGATETWIHFLGANNHGK